MPKQKEGHCCICGTYSKLSKEHTPPQSAFNNQTTFLKVFKEQNYGNHEELMRLKQHQGGIHNYVMCGKCNNDTGGYYAKAYVEFCRKLAPCASPSLEGKQLVISVPEVYPLRVFKHALVMLCATSGNRFAGKQNGFLRELIMHPEKRNIYFPDNLYLYIRSRIEGLSSSGVMGHLNTDTGKWQLGAEVSWWPIGWYLEFPKSQTPITGLNVNWWLGYDYHEKADLLITVPCRPATDFPLA